MTLIGPILDDRTFEQLRAELIQRIPVYTPEWTNHNDSDPGIALLDLFAFLGESLLYRFNQIPDATKTAFLRLLDVAPIPARPAQVLVVAETERPAGVQLLAKRELRAGPVSFETDGELYAWPLQAIGVGKTPVGAPPSELTDAQLKFEFDRRRDAARRLNVECDPVQYYETTVLPPDPAAGGLLDVAATVDRALWIALLATDTTNPALLAGRTVFLGVALDEAIDRPFTLDALDAAAADRYRSTGLDEDAPAALWQLWQPGANPQDPTDVGTLQPLEVADDSTKGITQTGVVALTLPQTFAVPDPNLPPGGAAGSPPPLSDPDVATRVIAWLQVTRPKNGGEAIHRVRWMGANAVQATQARTAGPELLGVGTGEAGQRYSLQNTGVLPGSAAVEVEEAGQWRTWQEVDGFVGAREGDRYFIVDLAAGEVLFGPGGRQGRVPQIGERIRVRTYRYGGGSAGNVPAGAVNAVVSDSGLKISNPLPALGGRDAEALGETLERIPQEVHRRDRAVTAEDFTQLARQVDGVARADALPLLHPDTPREPAAGVVSVMIFPTEDLRDPGAPMPDRGLLRRVARHLDQRRLVTTELYVIPPEYRGVSVAAGVVVKDGYQVDAVRRWVELILRQFLAPVPPYGPDGAGWPLGRAVRRAELEAVAVQVDGVEYLEGLRLATVNGQTRQELSLVELATWQAPALKEITVVQGPPLEPGVGYQPLPPATPAGTKIVPLPRDVC